MEDLTYVYELMKERGMVLLTFIIWGVTEAVGDRFPKTHNRVVALATALVLACGAWVSQFIPGTWFDVIIVRGIVCAIFACLAHEYVFKALQARIKGSARSGVGEELRPSVQPVLGAGVEKQKG